MLTVVEANPNRFLASLDKVKTRLQISGEGEDAFLASCIIEATDRIERFCDRVFVAETVQEKLPGSGDSEMMLTRRPVVEVTEIAYRGVAETVDDIEIIDAAAGFIYRESGFTSGRNSELGMLGTWPSPVSQRPDYAITYLGGYVCYPDPSVEEEEGEEDESDAPALPADLEGLCEQLVCILYDDRKRNTLRTSESEGDASTSYQTVDEWLEQNLKRWRSPV